MVKVTGFRVSLLTALLTLAFYAVLSQTQLMRSLEGMSLDFRFQLSGVTKPGRDVAVVLIDDKSVAEIGRWPWGRATIAKMVDQLAAAGARVIALDMLFLDPESRVSGEAVAGLEDLVRTLDGAALGTALEAVRSRLPALVAQLGLDEDAVLGQAMARAGKVVVPFSFVFAAPGSDPAPPSVPPDFIEASAFRTLRLVAGQDPRFALASRGLLAPLPAIGANAKALGHANVAIDVDGSARFEYPVLEYAGQYYPSFAVQIAREFLGLAPEEVGIDFASGLRVGGKLVPTDNYMRLLANLYGPEQTFPTYAFSDVALGRVPDDAFAGKAVLIGANAVGISDVFVTPYSAVVPGVERNANIVDNILSERFLQRPRLS